MRRMLYNLATDQYRGCVPGLIKAPLLVLSFVYGLAVRMLIFLCRLRPYRLKCNVISVGNITLGGTGKTTLVESLTRYLKQEGHTVAILSRGYKRACAKYGMRNTEYENMGDEPYLLKMNLGDTPVIVDTNRIRAGNRAIREYGVDTVILDDGFQQWKLKKDLEIVAIDATNPFGNRQLLPRGILREPLSSLARADIFVVTKTNLKRDIKGTTDLLSRLNPAALIVESQHAPLGFYELGTTKEESLEPGGFKGKTVALVSGIGDPDSFEAVMRGLGVTIGLSFRFPDHHNYTRPELENIVQRTRSKNIDTVVTTEKDAARLDGIRVTSDERRNPVHSTGRNKSYAPGTAQSAVRLQCMHQRWHCNRAAFVSTDGGIRIYVLRIALLITKNEKEFFSRLLKLYSL